MMGENLGVHDPEKSQPKMILRQAEFDVLIRAEMNDVSQIRDPEQLRQVAVLLQG